MLHLNYFSVASTVVIVPGEGDEFWPFYPQLFMCMIDFPCARSRMGGLLSSELQSQCLVFVFTILFDDGARIDGFSALALVTRGFESVCTRSVVGEGRASHVPCIRSLSNSKWMLYSSNKRKSYTDLRYTNHLFPHSRGALGFSLANIPAPAS